MIEVKVVTLKGCPHCEAVRKVLNKLKSEYSELTVKEIDVETPEGQKYIKQYNLTGAPGIIINDKLFKQGEATEEEFRKQFDLLIN